MDEESRAERAIRGGVEVRYVEGEWVEAQEDVEEKTEHDENCDTKNITLV